MRPPLYGLAQFLHPSTVHHPADSVLRRNSWPDMHITDIKLDIFPALCRYFTQNTPARADSPILFRMSCCYTHPHPPQYLRRIHIHTHHTPGTCQMINRPVLSRQPISSEIIHPGIKPSLPLCAPCSSQNSIVVPGSTLIISGSAVSRFASTPGSA